MQMYDHFCQVVGSLEMQFRTDLAPTVQSAPSATQKALSAANARGAGLYGQFLKGMIDRISDPDLPARNASIPKEITPKTTNSFNTRYYKVVQHRTEVYDIVTRSFHTKTGWEELPHGLGLKEVWNLMWTWSKPKIDYSRLFVWQKVNHYPENKHLTRKDYL